jgi:hypothetical protein
MEWYEWTLLGLALVIAPALTLVMLFRRLRSWQQNLAMIAFPTVKNHLTNQFLKAASATGKPRGLRWNSCEWEDLCLFARHRPSGQLTAFQGVTIHFEAIEGGDMEGVEAVGMPRNATAVFYFDRGQWQTAGRTVFNLNPAEAIERFKGEYDPCQITPIRSQG